MTYTSVRNDDLQAAREAAAATLIVACGIEPVRIPNQVRLLAHVTLDNVWRKAFAAATDGDAATPGE